MSLNDRNSGLFSRRSILQTSLVGGIAASAISNAPAAEPDRADGPAEGLKILFQGDSITDAGRDRKRNGSNDARSLGRGYPTFVAAGLLSEYPGRKLTIHNRGISGNKVPDLQKRWEKDCLEIKPDVLSILIGVNDIWHMLNGRYDGTVEIYRDGYTKLLEQTQQALPDTKIYICEPFVLRCGAVTDKWFPEFDKRLAAARDVAKKLSLPVVPFQTMFDEAVKDAPPAYWAGDGVHPSLAGHALMAKTWREVVGV